MKNRTLKHIVFAASLTTALVSAPLHKGFAADITVVQAAPPAQSPEASATVRPSFFEVIEKSVNKLTDSPAKTTYQPVTPPTATKPDTVVVQSKTIAVDKPENTTIQKVTVAKPSQDDANSVMWNTAGQTSENINPVPKPYVNTPAETRQPISPSVPRMDAAAPKGSNNDLTLQNQDTLVKATEKNTPVTSQPAFDEPVFEPHNIQNRQFDGQAVSQPMLRDRRTAETLRKPATAAPIVAPQPAVSATAPQPMQQEPVSPTPDSSMADEGDVQWNSNWNEENSVETTAPKARTAGDLEMSENNSEDNSPVAFKINDRKMAPSAPPFTGTKEDTGPIAFKLNEKPDTSDIGTETPASNQQHSIRWNNTEGKNSAADKQRTANVDLTDTDQEMGTSLNTQDAASKPQPKAMASSPGSQSTHTRPVLAETRVDRAMAMQNSHMRPGQISQRDATMDSNSAQADVAPMAESNKASENTQAPQNPVDLTLTFKGADSDLDADMRQQLDSIAQTMETANGRRLQLRSYAASVDGSNSSSRRVSLGRAITVRQYLMGQGVSPTRIDVRAMGDETQTSPMNRIDMAFVE